MLKNKKVCRFFKNYDIIIPVPIHKNRKLERGYNQSALLAKELASNFKSLQYIDDVLLKKVDNYPFFYSNISMINSNIDFALLSL